MVSIRYVCLESHHRFWPSFDATVCRDCRNSQGSSTRRETAESPEERTVAQTLSGFWPSFDVTVCRDCRNSRGSSTRRKTAESPEDPTLSQTKGKSLCRAPTKSAMPFLMTCMLWNRSEAQKNNSRVSFFTLCLFKKETSSILPFNPFLLHQAQDGRA